MRFWVVWEAFVNSLWQLYASNAILIVDDVNTPINAPQQPELSQNYPNPFNPSTTVSFTIPHPSFVIVRVYDVLGREVVTLVNEEKPPGQFEIPWDARGLAGGVYFLRLSVRTPGAQEKAIVQTRKMLLIR